MMNQKTKGERRSNEEEKGGNEELGRKEGRKET